MNVPKFKITTDSEADGMIFIDGPNDLLLGLDFTRDTHKQRQRQAKKVVRLLNKHWDAPKKVKAE